MTSSVIAKGFFDRRLWRGTEFKQGVQDMLAVTPGVCAWGLVTGVAMMVSVRRPPSSQAIKAA